MKNNQALSKTTNKGNDNMKRSTRINKITALLTVLSLILIISLVFVGCKSDKKGFTDQIDNLKNAKTVSCAINVKDGEIVVYDYSKQIAVDGDNATVTEVENKLSDGFQMASTENVTEVKNIDKSAFCPINAQFFQAGMTETKEGKTTKYVSVVDADSIKVYVGVYDDVNVEGEGSLTILSTDAKIDSITLSYNTTSGKTVTVTYAYAY